MGVLADRLAGSERRDWLTDDDSLFEGRLTGAGVRVNQTSAMQLSTVWGCVRLLTNTIATLPTDIVVRIGPARFPEFTKPPWLSSPVPADPTLTWPEHIGQVVTSLLLDGNFFVFVPGSVFYPDELHVLDPRRVDVRREGKSPVFDVRDENGQVAATIDAMRMLHGTWVRQPGALRGLSPIEAARQGIGSGIAAEEFGGRFFGQGASLSFGVEVPGPLTDKAREELRDSMKRRYAGVSNSHAVGVLTNGAKFVTGLGITNEQAQFLETRKFTVEDIAGRIYGIPPHKMGSQEPGASSYNSVEQRNHDFRQDAVLPIATRLESQYDRLVEVPSRLRAAGATAQFRFNLDVVVRADLKTRFEAYGQGVTNGILKPDEARAFEDLPPTPGGNVTYVQQQMVPLGTLPPGPTVRSQEEVADG